MAPEESGETSAASAAGLTPTPKGAGTGGSGATPGSERSLPGTAPARPRHEQGVSTAGDSSKFEESMVPLARALYLRGYCLDRCNWAQASLHRERQGALSSFQNRGDSPGLEFPSHLHGASWGPGPCAYSPRQFQDFISACAADPQLSPDHSDRHSRACHPYNGPIISHAYGWVPPGIGAPPPIVDKAAA